MEKISVFAAVALVALFWVKNAYANLMWPDFFAETKLFAWLPILICLAIEYPFVRKATGFDVKKSILADIVVNSVSSFAGLFLIPLSTVPSNLIQGLIIYSASKSNMATSPAAWAILVTFRTLLNAAIEAWTVQAVFKIEKRWSTLWWFFLANALSAAWIGLLTFLSLHPSGTYWSF